MRSIKIIIFLLISALCTSIYMPAKSYAEEFQKKPKKTKVSSKKKTQSVKGYTTKSGKKVKSYKRSSKK